MNFGAVAQLEEHLICIQKVVGSIPSGSKITASIAQLVEHFHGKEGVISSNLIGSSISNEGVHIVNIIWRLLLGRLRFLTF